MKKYRDYIRSLPCVVCSDDSGSDIHHLIQVPGVTKGVARTLPDLIAIPLCRKHHDTLHANPAEFELWYGKQADLLVKTQIRALADGKIDYAGS